MFQLSTLLERLYMSPIVFHKSYSIHHLIININLQFMQSFFQLFVCFFVPIPNVLFSQVRKLLIPNGLSSSIKTRDPLGLPHARDKGLLEGFVYDLVSFPGLEGFLISKGTFSFTSTFFFPLLIFGTSGPVLGLVCQIFKFFS